MMAPSSDGCLVVLAARRRRDGDGTLGERGAGVRPGYPA